MVKSAGLFSLCFPFCAFIHLRTVLIFAQAGPGIKYLWSLLLVEHFLVDNRFFIVQVSCQKIFLHLAYSFFNTYNAKFSMLQVPYEKEFVMPDFKLFLLTVSHSGWLPNKNHLVFRARKILQYTKDGMQLIILKWKYFSPIVFIDIPHFFTQKGSHIHPTSDMSGNMSCFGASKLRFPSELHRIAIELHSVLTL